METTKNMLKLKESSCLIKKSDGSLVLSDLDKANIFGEHHLNMIKPHSNVIPNTARYK